MSSKAVNLNGEASDLLTTGCYQPAVETRVLNFINGDTYEGETLAELRHGKGLHKCANGDSHDGFWYKGMRHGLGVATFARGFSYDGDFEYDRAHGLGKAKYETGAVYEGAFEDNKRSGWGVQYFPDESLYVGEWANDLMEGKGRLTASDGSFFEGEWAAGSQICGKWVSANQQEAYSGEWSNGQRAGSGTLHIAHVLQYSGEWRDGMQHGKGKCRWIDGSVFDGDWWAGCRQGSGVLARADGYKYDGQWKEDREHGTGNAKLANGDRYTGEFHKGQPHGKGRLLTVSKARYEGEFVAGKRQGHGKCMFANGDKYSGMWHDGKRHGEGSCQFADGTVFHGSWHQDQWLQSEAEPSLSRVAGPGLAGAVAGQDASLTILAKDELRNKRLAGGDSFIVWLEGPATVHAFVSDRENGTYTATYMATIAGIYDLYITNDTGESVAEAPYPVRITAAQPDARHSTFKLQSSAAVVGCCSSFVVEARDKHSNRCKLAKLPEEFPLECELVCGVSSCAVELNAAPGGCYTCSFAPNTSGFYRLSLSSAGTALSGSPASIEVRPPDGEQASASTHKLMDTVAEWKERAAQQYTNDGDDDGWSSDASQTETAEQKYIKEHPEVPVVENLRDMWRVTKLQQERKANTKIKQALCEQEELQRVQKASEASSSTHQSELGM